MVRTERKKERERVRKEGERREKSNKKKKKKGEKGRHGVHGSVADWTMARVRVFSLPSDLPSLSF